VSGPLTGRRVAIVGADTTLATALADRGAEILDGVGDGPLDALVVSLWANVAHPARATAELTDAEFERAWEGTMRTTITALRDARTQMLGRGGRLVVIVPTISMSGAPQLMAWSAAAEGQRILMKSVARQWGVDQITANVVAVAPRRAGTDAGVTSLAPAALADDDPADVVAFLCSAEAGAITGQTLTCDGGVWI
jgi:3-oxoacyl-[acyl-carrier protein] reductase